MFTAGVGLRGAGHAQDVQPQPVAGIELVADGPQLDVVPALLADAARVRTS